MIGALNIMFIVMGVWIMMTLSFLLMIKRFFHKAKTNEALVRTGFGETRVSFTGIMAIPAMHELERLDLTTRKISLDFEGLKCLEGAEVELRASFYLEVEKTAKSVLNVVKLLGVGKALDDAALKDLFKEKFTEAMTLACSQFSLQDLDLRRREFKQFFKESAWTEVKGFHLQDLTLDQIEKINKKEKK